MLSSSCLCYVNDSCSCLLYEADWSLAGWTSYIMELYEIVKGEIKLSISRAQNPQYPTIQELWSILERCRPYMASKKHDCNVQRAAQNSLHLTTCSPLWLDLSKCLKTLVPLTWTLSYTNLSEAEKQYCRNSSLRTVTADCKNLFFSVLLRRRETKWEWRKCWEGIMISSAFSTSFQTNTAVPEVWWSKLFDLWHKKLLQETISTLG